MSIGFTLNGLGGDLEERFTCSRARCSERAESAILWRNPKIHDEDRRKTWLACPEHLEVLRDFLSTRGFPLEVRTIEEIND